MLPVRLWFRVLPDRLPWGSDVLCRMGLVGDGLKIVREADEVVGQADAWLVPAGRAGHASLVQAVLATGKPLLVTINGIGDKALAALCAATGPALVLTFDARGLDNAALVEQLAWLRGRPEPFAIIAEDESAAMLAAMAGAAALVVGGEDGFDPAAVLRVLAASRVNAPRPISPAEVDGLDGREMCLTVRRTVLPGEILAAADLAVAATDTRGLAPMLAERVAGLRLRYPIAPGEPLHFGHFEDPTP